MPENLPMLWRDDSSDGLTVIIDPDGKRLTLRVESKPRGQYLETYFFADGTGYGGRTAARLRTLADWLDGSRGD